MRGPARSAGNRTSPNSGLGMRACSLLLCSLIVLIQLAQGQTPPAGRVGDPSVARDTIYRLAVSSDDHPDEDAVVLLDDAAVRYELDGTGVESYRQVVQVLKPEAVEGYAEHEFSYSPAHQRLTVNWIRVVRPDGTLASAQRLRRRAPDDSGTPGRCPCRHQTATRLLRTIGRRISPGRTGSLSS